MALKRPQKEAKKEDPKGQSEEEGPNDHLGEEPIDAPVGYAPRVVKVPMNQNADVNPDVHAAKMEEKKQRAKSNPKVELKKGAGWNAKDERQYKHIKESGASESIAAATVNKQRRKEGRLLHKGAQEMTTPNVTLMKANKGPGSRGGKVVRHTKGGKPVYESQAKKHAEMADKMMTNWHQNATNSNDPEHHAIAAKQALHAAYYHHHAGDEVASHQAMDYASHHRAAYEKAGHVSRTTRAIDKLHHQTAHEVGHAGWEPEEHGLSAEHSVANDARKEGKHKEADKLRENSSERKAAGKYEVKPVKGSQAYTAHHVDEHGTRTPIGPGGSHGVGNGMHPGKHFAESAVRSHQVARAGGRGDVKKALTPSNNTGGNMSKNEVEELFKSELGASNAKPITKCVHCSHDLTRDDLKKGLGHHTVADDNDNPHDGPDNKTNSETPVRGVPGAKEHDEIAPLLKGLKGPDAGDKEEYPIHKSEMLTMGMNADDLEDGWYTITKGEMQKQAPEHLAYLADRKSRVAKAMKPSVNSLKKGQNGETIAKGGNGTRSTTDGPHGYSPRAGGVHGPAGEQLVQWSEGSDKQVADFIEKSGGFGPGTDESIRTEGRGH